MDAKQPDDKCGQRPRQSYLPPSRMGLKAITAHVPPEWSVALKVHGAKTGRSLQSLVEEALTDLAGKLDIDLWAVELGDGESQADARPGEG